MFFCMIHMPRIYEAYADIVYYKYVINETMIDGNNNQSTSKLHHDRSNLIMKHLIMPKWDSLKTVKISEHLVKDHLFKLKEILPYLNPHKLKNGTLTIIFDTLYIST